MSGHGVQEERARRVRDVLRGNGWMTPDEIVDEAGLERKKDLYNARQWTDLLDDIEMRPDPDDGRRSQWRLDEDAEADSFIGTGRKREILMRRWEGGPS